MSKIFIAVLCLFAISLSAQDKKTSAFIIEGFGSTQFDSKRWFNVNEQEDYIYGEIRVGYRLNKYFETNFFVGYTRRYYGYFAQDQFGSLYLLNMERHYIPLGISVRLYFSDFFFENLKLCKKQDKWDIYNQVGFAVLKGKDIRDTEGENYYKSLGYYVPFYFYPYIERYGKKYLVFIAGIRYNFNKKIGVLLEGGHGSFTDLQIGISAKF